jgi:hypothetical protein
VEPGRTPRYSGLPALSPGLEMNWVSPQECVGGVRGLPTVPLWDLAALLAASSFSSTSSKFVLGLDRPARDTRCRRFARGFTPQGRKTRLGLLARPYREGSGCSSSFRS